MRTEVLEQKLEYLEMDDGVRLHIRDWGVGKPVVFIHGWPLSNEMYEYQFNELRTKGFRCIGITLRGFGKSDQPDGIYDYDVFVNDIYTVIDRLNLSNVIMIGFSMGGAIAAHYTALHPEQVSKLVLIGAAAPLWTQRDDFPYGHTKDIVNDFIKLNNTNRPLLIKNFEQIFTASEDSLPDTIKEWLHGINLQASSIAMDGGLKALRDSDLRKELQQINVPTAIFHGKKDKICPFDLAEQMKKLIKSSVLIPFENSGHAIFYEEREKLNSELLKFMK